ncbi:hypothetical protein D3C85_1752490 [compost metagenome]
MRSLGVAPNSFNDATILSNEVPSGMTVMRALSSAMLTVERRTRSVVPPDSALGWLIWVDSLIATVRLPWATAARRT